VLAEITGLASIESRDAINEPGIWPWQGVYADALVDVGRLDAAERFLPRHEALAENRGRGSMIGRLARSRGRLEAARDNHTAAEQAFRRSAEALLAVAMPYEVALTQMAHGQFLRRRRQRRAAISILSDARNAFDGLGAEPALQICERELQAAGLSSRQPTEQGLGRLSPQELTVARHVIDGMSNREIAAELMLSVRTVEVHLTHIYTKLEVRSRSELRARARSGEFTSADN
jgi:DNA-binding CsgD family transcriptional regulator